MKTVVSFAFTVLISTLSRHLSIAVQTKEFYRCLPPVDYSLANAVKTDVLYKYFKNVSDEGKYLTEETVSEANLDKNIPTVLLIHGWTTDDTSPWYKPIKDAYFGKGPHNIIYINWSKAGNLTYDISAANVKPVGQFIAEFLIKSGVLQQNIHLVGHSLGSHLTSFIGKYMFSLSGKKIGRITALDPAGPKFENDLMTSDLRLCSEDAGYVEVIHTDIQFYGYTKPIGHVDYYPNQGKHQPGCPSKLIDDNCCHARSTLYFIESINTNKTAKEAKFEQDNFWNVTVTVIENGEEIIFGQNTKPFPNYTFYFETNDKEPFL